MAEQTQQEKNLETARAVIDKRAPLKPEHERAEGIRAKRMEAKTPAEVFAFMQESPIHERRFHELKESAIGKSAGDRANPLRDTEENNRAAAIDKYGRWIQTFDEKGFATLSAALQTTAEGRTVEEGVYDAVLALAERLPQADGLFAGMSRSERKAIVRDMLNDKEFKAMIRKVVSERTDVSKFSEELNDEVGQRKTAFKEAERLERDKAEELKEIKAEQNAVKRRLAELNKKDVPHRDYSREITDIGNKIDEFKNNDEKGKKIEALNNALRGTDEAVADNAVKSLNAQLLLAQQQLGEYRTVNPKTLGGVDTEENAKNKKDIIKTQNEAITSLQGQKAKAEGQLALIRTYVREKDDLQLELKMLEQQKKELERESRLGNINDRNTLEDKKEELVAKERQASKEHRDAQDRRYELQADYDAAKVRRESREQDVVESLKLENVFSEAARRHYEEQWSSMAEAQEVYFKELEEKATSTVESTLVKGLRNQWEGEKQRRRGFLWLKTEQDKKILNKQVEADYNSVLEGNVKDVMRSVLKKGEMKDAEIDEKMKDTNFVKEQSPRVVAEVVRYKMMTGKITPGEARYIFDNWGAELIPQQLERNNTLKTQLDEMRKKGVINENGWNWLKRKSDGSLLQFLLVLLGAGVTFGTTKFVENWRESIKE